MKRLNSCIELIVVFTATGLISHLRDCCKTRNVTIKAEWCNESQPTLIQRQRRRRLTVRHAMQVMTLASLCYATASAFAQIQVVSQQAAEDHVWRCSLDGKYYAVDNSNGLQIKAVGSGQLSANVPFMTDKKGRIKTDKQGRGKLEGQWGTSAFGGLIWIKETRPDYVAGYMLVPTPGTPSSLCTSRTAAVVFSFGQPGPICNVLSVSWNLEPAVSESQAAAEETQEVIQRVSFVTAQPSSVSGSAQQLVGTWSKEVFDGYYSNVITLKLHGDGTYTKTLSKNGAQSGTWTSSGLNVHLSGDGKWPATNENLSSFGKIQ